VKDLLRPLVPERIRRITTRRAITKIHEIFAERSLEETFSDIYRNGAWGDGITGPASGSGSDRAHARCLRKL
jgi:hypothetical protein